MGYADSVSVSQIHGSVTRGHYIAGDFWEHNTHINTNSKNDEIVIDICHPSWQGLMRLFAQRATHLNTGDAGDILFFDNDLLTVKWDQWDEEHFIRDDSGVFHLKQ